MEKNIHTCISSVSYSVTILFMLVSQLNENFWFIKYYFKNHKHKINSLEKRKKCLLKIELKNKIKYHLRHIPNSDTNISHTVSRVCKLANSTVIPLRSQEA